MFRLDEELRRLPCRDVGCGDEIAQRPETAFESEAGLFDHLCVQPYAAELDKIFPIRTRQIEQTDVCAFDDNPAALKIVNGKPSSIAKTFTLPIGSTPNVALLPASPFATWLTVPSPPAATIRVNPASTARLASAFASPECAVIRTGHSPASDSMRSCQLRICSGLPAVGLRMTIVSVTRKSSRGLSPFLQSRTA